MNNENEKNELKPVEQDLGVTEVENEAVTEEFLESADSTEVKPAEEKPAKKRLSKKAQYRTIASVFTVLTVVIVVIVNLLVNALGQKVEMRLDLTQDKILAFSDQTKEVLAGLNEDVMVYSLIPENNDEILASLDSILDRYQKLSSHIKYEKVNTAQNPQFVQKYQKGQEQINQYSVIFECGDKFKVVDINSAIQMNSQTRQVQSLSAEQKFTSAIQYVSSDADVKAAFTQGHGEIGETVFKSILTDENYDVTTLNTATEDIAEDVSLLIIASPKTDFTAEEINKIDRFFDRGGKVQVFMDVNINALPRLEEYLKEWGIAFQPGFVVDTNRNNYMQSPLLLLPDILESDITSAIRKNNLMMIVPQARGIELSPVVGIESQTLLQSSKQSFIRVKTEEQSVSMTDGDIAGPAALAALQSKYVADGKATAQLFVMGNTAFADATFMAESAYANKDFYLNVTSAMSEKKDSLSIRAKDVSPAVLAISAVQALVLGAIVLILIPSLVLIIGLAVWIRRRHL